MKMSNSNTAAGFCRISGLICQDHLNTDGHSGGVIRRCEHHTVHSERGLCHAPISFTICPGRTTKPRVQRRHSRLNLPSFNAAQMLASLTQMLCFDSEKRKQLWNEHLPSELCVWSGENTPSQARFHVALLWLSVTKGSLSRSDGSTSEEASFQDSSCRLLITRPGEIT